MKQGSTKGSMSRLKNQLKDSLRETVQEAATEVLRGETIQVDDVKIGMNVDKKSLGNNIESQIQDAVPDTIHKEIEFQPEIKIKKIKGIALDSYITLDNKSLKKKINDLYKETASGTAEAEKGFIAAMRVGVARGLDFSTEQVEYLNALENLYNITSKEVAQINTEIAKVNFSNISQSLDAEVSHAQKAADKLEKIESNMLATAKRFSKRNNQNVGQAKPEQFMFANDETGYSIVGTNDRVGATTRSTIETAFKNKTQSVNSAWHSHPNELTAAFDWDDLDSAIELRVQGIIHQYIQSLEDVAMLDVSKFTDDQIRELGKYIKDNAFIDGGLKEEEAFNETIKGSLKEYLIKTADLFVKSINEQGMEINEKALKKKILDSFSKSTSDKFQDYDSFYETAYSKLLDSVKSLDINDVDVLADGAIITALSKGMQTYIENVFKRGIKHVTPDINIDDVYKKTSLKDYFGGESLLPEINIEKKLKNVEEIAQKSGSKTSKALVEISDAAEEAQKEIKKLSKDADISEITGEFENLENGSKRVISDIGLTYDQLVEKIKKENQEVQEGNRLFQERVAYLKNGMVVDSFAGEDDQVMGRVHKDFDQIVHTHPSGNLSGIFSPADLMRLYRERVLHPLLNQFDLFNVDGNEVKMRTNDLADKTLDHFSDLYYSLYNAIGVALSKEIDYGRIAPLDEQNVKIAEKYQNVIAQSMLRRLGGDIELKNIDLSDIDEGLAKYIETIAMMIANESSSFNTSNEDEYKSQWREMIHEKFALLNDWREQDAQDIKSSSDTTTSLAIDKIIQAENELGNEAQNATERAKQGLAEIGEAADNAREKVEKLAESEQVVGQVRDSSKQSDQIIFKATGQEISQEAYDILDKLKRGVDVSIEELRSIPEVADGLKELARVSSDFRKKYAELGENVSDTSDLHTEERKALRDYIISLRHASGSFSGLDENGKDVFNGAVQKQNKAVIVMGLPAAGKSTSIVNPLSQMLGAKVIDSDIIKELLPEYNKGKGSMLVHEESSSLNKRFLAEITESAKITKQGENVIVPIVGDTVEKVEKYIKQLTEAGYEVQVALNELPNNQASLRNLMRYFNVNRLIDPGLVRSKGDKPSEAFARLKSNKDIASYFKVSNDVPRGQRPTYLEGKNVGQDIIDALADPNAGKNLSAELSVIREQAEQVAKLNELLEKRNQILNSTDESNKATSKVKADLEEIESQIKEIYHDWNQPDQNISSDSDFDKVVEDLKEEQVQAEKTAEAEKELTTIRKKRQIASAKDDNSEELKQEAQYAEQAAQAEEQLHTVRTKRKIASSKDETSEELKEEVQQAEKASQAEEKLHTVRTKRKIASSKDDESSTLQKAKEQVEALTVAQEKLNDAKASETKSVNKETWEGANTVQDFNQIISQMELAKRSTAELKEMFAKIQTMPFDPSNGQDVLSYRNSIDLLSQTFTELGFKFSETHNKWLKVTSSAEEFKAAMQQQKTSTKEVIQAQDQLVQKQQEVAKADKISQNIKSERAEVEQNIDAEITALKSLADTIRIVAESVDRKTERFDEEKRVVIEAIDAEISKLQELRSELDAVSSKEEVIPKSDMPSLSISGEIVPLTDLYNLLNDIIIAIQEKTNAFNKEGSEVSASVKAENDTLTLLFETLKQIAGIVDKVKLPAGEKLQWTNDLRKLNPEDIEKIGTNLTTIYQAISKLNVKDSNFIKQLNDILSKGKELQNLATVLASSKKNIENVRQSTVSQKSKDTKSLYDSELKNRKKALELQHQINIADAQQASNLEEIKAANEPLIEMYNKRANVAADEQKKRRLTSQEFRNNIKAEIRVIEEKNNAEIKAVQNATLLKQNRDTVEKSISQLESLQSKLQKILNTPSNNLMPDSIDNINEKLVLIGQRIDDIKNKKIDVTDPKEIDELNDFVNATNQLTSSLEKQANAAKQSSVKSDIAGYLAKNTKLSREFKQELKNLGQQLESTSLSGDQLQKIVERFNDIKAAAREAGQEGQNFFSKFTNRLSDMNAKFLAQYFSWQDWIRYIRTAAQTVTELDTALTELRKVSDASTERLNQSFETSAQTAQELGSSISDVINMTADWARLGYDVDQAEELARVTTLFQTVGDNMSADNASSYLISTLQGFQMATDQAEDIVDAYNEVANNFAIDTAGIGEALQRSAASFNAANTDLSESIALVTATNEVLQNPESVGTLWKTLSARIRGATTELQELGEEEDEYTKTTSKLRDLVQGLTGFDIMQDENNFKDIYEIILGIGKEWDKLTDVERASLGEALAGKRNSNALYAVLGNLDTLQEAYQKAESSAGSAAKEQENYAQSVQYSIDRNKASLQELARDFLSSDLLKTLLELANSLLQTLDKIVEKIGPEGVLGIAGAIVALFKGNQIKSAFDWISGLGDVFSKLGSGASLASQAVETAEAVSEIGEAAEESFWFIDELADGGTAISTIEVAAEGASGEVATLGGGISALSGALIALAAVAVVVGAALAWDHFTTTVEEAEEAVNNAKSKVIDLQSEIDELSQIENRTDGQEKRLRLLQDELDYQTKILETRQKTLAVEKYGNKFSDQFDFDNAYTQYGIDKSNRYDVDNEGNFVAEGTSAKNNIALLQKYIDLSKDADLSEKERNKNAQYAEKQTEKLKEKYDNYLSEIIDYESKLDEINQDIDSGLISPDGDEESKAAYERAIEAQKAYALWIAQDKSIIAEIEKALGTYDYVQDDIKQLASKWETGSISSEYIANELIDHMDGFSEAEKAAFVKAIQDAKDWAEVLDIISRKQEEVNEQTAAVPTDAWNKDAALTKYSIDPEAFEEYLAVFKELNSELSLTDEEFEQAAVAQYALDQAVEDLRSHLNDYVEVLQNCDEASIEYANSIKTLAADLSAMTGIDFSITDAQTFAQDEANLELLRQALDGDNDALTRLRANAARNIVVSVSAELGTDEFAAQYDELVSWIAANPDLGVLEAQSHLESSDFIKTCFLLIQQGKMTAEQLKQIFANLKWNISWDTTTMKVPRLSSSGGSYTGLPSNVVADMKKQGTASKYLNANYGVKYDIIDVPTNIRFERGGSATTPKVSAPTSSSGSNYRPEQKSGSSGGGGGGGGSKDPTEEAKKDEEELEDTYDEFFDYFERRLKVVSDAISLLDAHLENVVGSNAKNTLLDAQMRIYKMQQQEYAGARDMYQEMADRALSKIEDSNIVEKIKNGAVGIDEFIGKGNEEVVNAINDYTKWADKVADCKQQLAELKETIRQLELTRMKNILQDWQDVFDLRQDNAIDLIDKQISLIEESGNLVGKAFYEQQKRQTEGQLSAMEQAKRELSAELNRGLANGSIEVGTDEWIEEVGLLQEVESNILDCKQAIEEYDNAILAIHTDTFERLIDKLDDLDDELSDIAAFFDDEKVGDKFGNWSEAGQAQAGLLAQQYELAQNKVKKYAEQIDWLNGQYNAGKYSTTEYTEQLAELMDAMRESAKDAESAKEAMLDLNKARVDIVIDGINEEIEAYSDLISKEKDALSAEKD